MLMNLHYKYQFLIRVVLVLNINRGYRKETNNFISISATVVLNMRILLKKKRWVNDH